MPAANTALYVKFEEVSLDEALKQGVQPHKLEQPKTLRELGPDQTHTFENKPAKLNRSHLTGLRLICNGAARRAPKIRQCSS